MFLDAFVDQACLVDTMGNTGIIVGLVHRRIHTKTFAVGKLCLYKQHKQHSCQSSSTTTPETQAFIAKIKDETKSETKLETKLETNLNPLLKFKTRNKCEYKDPPPQQHYQMLRAIHRI